MPAGKLSDFNYCPLVLMFSSPGSIKIIENIQKKALQILLSDYISTYEDLLDKLDRSSLDVNRVRTLYV